MKGKTPVRQSRVVFNDKQRILGQKKISKYQSFGRDVQILQASFDVVFEIKKIRALLEISQLHLHNHAVCECTVESDDKAEMTPTHLVFPEIIHDKEIRETQQSRIRDRP